MSNDMKFKLLPVSELTKAIVLIARNSSKITLAIQTAAVQCVAQSIVHRNATPAMQLFDALTAGFRRDSLVAYFEMFGNLAWSKTEKKLIFCDIGELTDKPPLKWDDDTAEKVNAKMWNAAKPEPTPKSMYDVSEEVNRLLESLSKKKAKGVTLKNGDLLSLLVATYNKYQHDEYVKSTNTKDEEDSQARQLAEQQAKAVAKAKAEGATEEQLVALREKFNSGAPALA